MTAATPTATLCASALVAAEWLAVSTAVVVGWVVEVKKIAVIGPAVLAAVAASSVAFVPGVRASVHLQPEPSWQYHGIRETTGHDLQDINGGTTTQARSSMHVGADYIVTIPPLAVKNPRRDVRIDAVSIVHIPRQVQAHSYRLIDASKLQGTPIGIWPVGGMADLDSAADRLPDHPSLSQSGDSFFFPVLHVTLTAQPPKPAVFRDVLVHYHVGDKHYRQELPWDAVMGDELLMGPGT